MDSRTVSSSSRQRLGFALLLASGLLIRGFLNVRHADTGFNAEHLFEFDVPLTLTRYPHAKKVIFYNELLPKLAALPGVHSVSGGHPLPLQDGTPRSRSRSAGGPILPTSR